MTRLLLTIGFFLILTPVALIRRAAGYDPMSLKRWKDGPESAFVKRNHTFAPGDMESPR
ncbi:hypothetical protein GM415_02290 [Pseudodesulfovibrio cashew]|uniref:Uncharacterized protein n=1 Tax=Pseudodesulfovibrio cashew TaxID=2678688 RepID=A0A6I6JAB8_9BACT|nr:hypothetical protein [Pseudodesulfovibrio cashew]QGY39011.1 hypothetical protein GM415_02290 [Pseudodesulfovibrio cashew]